MPNAQHTLVSHAVFTFNVNGGSSVVLRDAAIAAGWDQRTFVRAHVISSVANGIYITGNWPSLGELVINPGVTVTGAQGPTGATGGQGAHGAWGGGGAGGFLADNLSSDIPGQPGGWGSNGGQGGSGNSGGQGGQGLYCEVWGFAVRNLGTIVGGAGGGGGGAGSGGFGGGGGGGGGGAIALSMNVAPWFIYLRGGDGGLGQYVGVGGPTAGQPGNTAPPGTTNGMASGAGGNGGGFESAGGAGAETVLQNAAGRGGSGGGGGARGSTGFTGPTGPQGFSVVGWGNIRWITVGSLSGGVA